MSTAVGRRWGHTSCQGLSFCRGSLATALPHLTWAIGRLLGRHLHEQRHLLALREGVASANPRQPHAEKQPRLAGGRLLLDPFPLRALLLCREEGEGKAGSCTRACEALPGPSIHGTPLPESQDRPAPCPELRNPLGPQPCSAPGVPHCSAPTAPWASPGPVSSRSPLIRASTAGPYLSSGF